MADQLLHVRIISPQSIILDTEAESVSSKNQQGPFDILPLHANFITVTQDSEVVVRIKGQQPLSFQFPIAIILTTENRVNIYTYAQSSS